MGSPYPRAKRKHGYLPAPFFSQVDDTVFNKNRGYISLETVCEAVGDHPCRDFLFERFFLVEICIRPAKTEVYQVWLCPPWSRRKAELQLTRFREDCGSRNPTKWVDRRCSDSADIEKLAETSLVAAEAESPGSRLEQSEKQLGVESSDPGAHTALPVLIDSQILPSPQCWLQRC